VLAAYARTSCSDVSGTTTPTHRSIFYLYAMPALSSNKRSSSMRCDRHVYMIYSPTYLVVAHCIFTNSTHSRRYSCILYVWLIWYTPSYLKFSMSSLQSQQLLEHLQLPIHNLFSKIKKISNSLTS